jgi:hypothetical protein
MMARETGMRNPSSSSFDRGCHSERLVIPSEREE